MTTLKQAEASSRCLVLIVAGGSEEDRNDFVNQATVGETSHQTDGQISEMETLCESTYKSEDSDAISIRPPIAIHFLNTPNLDTKGYGPPSADVMRRISDQIGRVWNPGTDAMGLILLHDIRKPKTLKDSCRKFVKAFHEVVPLERFDVISIMVTHGDEIPIQKETSNMLKILENPKDYKSAIKASRLFQISKSPKDYNETWDILDLHHILKSDAHRELEDAHFRVTKLKKKCKKTRIRKWAFNGAEAAGLVVITAAAATMTAFTGGLAIPVFMAIPIVGVVLEDTCKKERERHALMKQDLQNALQELRNSQFKLQLTDKMAQDSKTVTKC